MIDAMQVRALAQFGEEMPRRVVEWRGTEGHGPRYWTRRGPDARHLVYSSFYDIVDLVELVEKLKAEGKDVPSPAKPVYHRKGGKRCFD